MKNHPLLFIFFILSTLAFSEASATVIQILHTNDLHASLISAGAPLNGSEEKGGWAQLKTVMDRLTLEAQIQGIETLKLDAGDFSEGTVHYFPDRGIHVLKAFQSIGYDAVALGNHDWMQGARAMNTTYGLAPFPFPVLASNVWIADELEHLKKQIVPTASIQKAGVRIGIVGLTTPEAFYKWNLKVGSAKNDFKIFNLFNTAQAEIDDLKTNHDLVLALSHIGIKEDQKLAQSTTGLDLIVGGHSHTEINQPIYESDLNGDPVPLVQNSCNGISVGKIRIEVKPGQRPKILSYELVPVLNTEKPDSKIASLIEEAEAALNRLYGKEVLNEILGQSSTPLQSGENGATAFSQFAANAIKTETDSQLSIDIAAFHGNTIVPAGKIKRRDLMQMIPRKFEVEQNEGWYVYQVFVPGWFIKLGVKFAVEFGYYLGTSGLTYQIRPLPADQLLDAQAHYQSLSIHAKLSSFRAHDLRINDLPICNRCWYQVATPEGTVRGAYGITPLTELFLRNGRSSGVTMWDALAKSMLSAGTLDSFDPNQLTTKKSVGRKSKQNLQSTQYLIPENQLYTAPLVERFIQNAIQRARSGRISIHDNDSVF
jgi:2',3'-cyclic-nucleotide 2'-phosphodiesterase (5'-nucleotidase family)